MQIDLEPSLLAGQLIVGGFQGSTLPASFAGELAKGRRAGAILFKRNLPTLGDASALCHELSETARRDLPPFIGVDQEGGRVVRLPSPVLALPPMRELASFGDLELVQAAANAVGDELRSIGFNIDFAPVLDVNTEANNPVIGDRAFGSDARTVARFGVAFARGLQQAMVLACGKHFPGHGDTTADSHLDLPVVRHGRARLDQVELPPFRAAAGAGIGALMTAHVVYEELDPGVPATLSRAICASLLRAELGFEGVLFSDDLEMKAIAARWTVERAAVDAVWAGCDALLICSDEAMQARAHEALLHEIETSTRFRERCVEAVERSLRVRRLVPPNPVAELRHIVDGEKSRAVMQRIAQKRGTSA
ncbi:MAG TPA: beta-N-acetylhexosaminidase [Polyangiaceae bacterium]